MSDQTYPVYRLSIEYERNATPDEQPEKGERFTDHTSWLDWMFRAEPTPEELAAKADEAWRRNVVEKTLGPEKTPLASLSPAIVSREIKLVGFEPWALRWFSHYTIDDGRTDAEYLASFERYVRRYEHMQGDFSRIERYGDDYRCLMGAEDRWRWRGKDGAPPPCRCEGCTAHDVVSITH